MSAPARPLAWKVDTEKGCWNCTSHGPNSPGGYPTIWRNGRHVYAHRLVWEQTNGRPIPPGMFVCHSCDNPACINPAHLWLGTQADNNRDMATKGRSRVPHPAAKGEANGGARLTEEQVYYIREHIEISQTKMGEEMGVSQSTISLIRTGKKWRHLL